MIRFALALATSLALSVAVRAADLPTGTWAVNINGTKGELVITAVSKDGKVTGKLLGADFTGTWKDDALTVRDPVATLEGCLVAEPAEKGKVKYTLTGIRRESAIAELNVPPPETKSGWYAQIVADAPVPLGAIKAEIRGVLVYDGVDAYVSVKRKTSFGDVEETRVWIWATEGEWKLLKLTIPSLNGKEVIATGKLAQLPKGHMTSIPEGALFFLGRFDIKLAEDPKKSSGSADPSRKKD
jgi:hypothetical protein